MSESPDVVELTDDAVGGEGAVNKPKRKPIVFDIKEDGGDTSGGGGGGAGCPDGGGLPALDTSSTAAASSSAAVNNVLDIDKPLSEVIDDLKKNREKERAEKEAAATGEEVGEGDGGGQQANGGSGRRRKRNRNRKRKREGGQGNDNSQQVTSSGGAANGGGKNAKADVDGGIRTDGVKEVVASKLVDKVNQRIQERKKGQVAAQAQAKVTDRRNKERGGRRGSGKNGVGGGGGIPNPYFRPNEQQQQQPNNLWNQNESIQKQQQAAALGVLMAQQLSSLVKQPNMAGAAAAGGPFQPMPSQVAPPAPIHQEQFPQQQPAMTMMHQQQQQSQFMQPLPAPAPPQRAASPPRPYDNYKSNRSQLPPQRDGAAGGSGSTHSRMLDDFARASGSGAARHGGGASGAGGFGHSAGGFGGGGVGGGGGYDVGGRSVGQAAAAAGVDLEVASRMPPKEMLRYVNKCSHVYAQELDRRFPDVRKVMGRLVRTCVRDAKGGTEPGTYVPCDLYNQDDSCYEELVHYDSTSNRRIHSCTICYFSLGGMINLHRQTQCPLLSLMK